MKNILWSKAAKARLQALLYMKHLQKETQLMEKSGKIRHEPVMMPLKNG